MFKILKIFRSFWVSPSTLGRPLSRAYIPELDGLRFVALVLVLIWHSSIRATRYSERVLHTDGLYSFFPHGEIGVLLFFCISGYVVSQPFLVKSKQDWNIKSFYWRRFIRIYPPYFIALSFCFFVLQVVGHVPKDAKAYAEVEISLVSSYLASVFYLHSFLFDAPSRLNPPIWSLELEIIFYALAPAFLFFYVSFTNKKLRIYGLSGLILGLISLTAIAASESQIDGRFRWGFLSHFHLFLLGILAADLAGNALINIRNKSRKADVCFILGFMGLVAIGLEMTRVDARFDGAVSTFLIQLSFVLGLTLICYGAFYGRTSSRLLSLSWVRLIGTMCYSVYLTHIVTMQVASELLGRFFLFSDTTVIWFVWLGVLISTSMLVGFIFYIFIERPFASAAKASSRDAPTSQDVLQKS